MFSGKHAVFAYPFLSLNSRWIFESQGWEDSGLNFIPYLRVKGT